MLRTNIDDMETENIALTYKQLWILESLFRDIKSLLDTRPIYHKCAETIRGHVFCSFLALLLMRELQEKMDDRGWMDAEWKDVIRDLDTIVESEVEASSRINQKSITQLREYLKFSGQKEGVVVYTGMPVVKKIEDRDFFFAPPYYLPVLLRNHFGI